MEKNVSKFNWREIFSNNSGKTSGSGFSGVISILVGLIGFLSGIVMYYLTNFSIHAPEVMQSSLTLIGIGAALLGVRKIFKDKDKLEINNEPESQSK